MEDAYEELVRWYLRFNGYLSIENFIVHEPTTNASTVPQGAELDTIGVRFPFSREIVEGVPTKHVQNDSRLVLGASQPGDPIDFLIAEVKSGGRVSLNSVWSEPADPIKEQRIKYVLGWLGPFLDEALIANIAHKIQTQHRVCEQGYSFRLVLFTHRKQIQGLPASILTITFGEIARFIVDSRASSWSQLKIARRSHHPQWSGMINAIWKLAGPEHVCSPERKVTDILGFVEQENRLRRPEQQVRNLITQLLSSPLCPFDDKLRGVLPEQHGLYIIYDNTTSPPTGIRAGRTKTATGGLRQRVYGNHLMGNQRGNLRQQLVGATICKDVESAKSWVKEHCQVRFLIVDDDKLRCWAEHYMLAVVRPKYGD